MPAGWSAAKPGPRSRTAVHCDGIGRPSQPRGWAGGVHDKTVGIATAARRAAPGSHRLGARASRPHPVPLAAAELQCDAAGNPIGQAEGEPWRRSRLIQVGERTEAVPGFVRAGRPRSQGAGGTPALPGSRHPMTPSPQGHQIAEAFWRRLWLKQVHLSSGLFVFIRVHWWFVFIDDRPFLLQ